MAHQSPPAAPPGSRAEVEARRCHVCGCKYPIFIFGPPLTKPDEPLFACGDHVKEVERLLSPQAVPLRTPKDDGRLL